MSAVRRVALVVLPIVVLGGLQVPAQATPRPVSPHGPATPAQPAPGKGRGLPVKQRAAASTPKATVTPPTWPVAATADVPNGRTADVGGLKVRIARAAQGKARVRVIAGRPMVAVTPGPGPVDVSLGYDSFAGAYGGDYGARLRLVRMPDCALTTPERADCQAGTPIASRNDTAARTLSATVTASAAGGPVLLAAEADEKSSQGNYSATKLTTSSDWNVALASGGFTWSYPIRVPKPANGLAPNVKIDYSSQAVDGKTANTNNQGSWVGEGFGYEPGYIERRFRSCEDDGHKDYGDECWAGQNLTIMLEGRATELVRVDDNTFKLGTDDGSKIERRTDTVNGDNDNEYWVLTTPEGMQYYFGLNRLPGWTANRAETNSTWTTQVSGDDANEPCNSSSGWLQSFCAQAWRWNLDYVKDTHKSVIAYWYGKETNAYARGRKTDVDGVGYDRGGYLRRADYGQSDGAVYTTNAPGQVVFDTAERCIPSDTITCAESQLSTSTAYAWPDVPWDRNCNAGTHCKLEQSQPTFWTRKRLTGITTRIRTGSTWSDVEKWTFTHSFTSNGDGSKTLWLDKIDHAGVYNGDYVSGGTQTMPSLSFVGIQLDNRVDSDTDMLAPLKRYRLSTIYTDTGGQIQVNYLKPDCSATNKPAEGKSTVRCFPVKWNPFDPDKPTTDWFYKYVVDQVIVQDRTGGNPDMVTKYDYVGDAGWRKAQPDGITKDDYLTWSDWRGYETVRVRTGDMQTLSTRVDHTFFRGLDGEVRDSAGGTHADTDELAGQELETTTYNGGAVVDRKITVPKLWFTRTQTESWGSRKAYMIKPETVRGFGALGPDPQGNPRWAETKTVTTYDTRWGRPTQANDFGDVSTTADDRCTRIEYADNETLYRYAYRKLEEKFATDCGVADPDRATKLLTSKRLAYDGKDYGVAPTAGDITRTDVLDSATSGATTYLTTVNEVDGWGRVTKTTDARNIAATTAYVDVDGFNTQRTVTNPLGHATVVDYLPAFGQERSQTDANLKRTDFEFDALGRMRKVWSPMRPKASGFGPDVQFEYLIRADKPVVTTTKTIQNDGTYRPTYELRDGLLRLRQQQQPGPNGTWLVSDEIYTPTGKVAVKNAPYAVTGTPGNLVIVTPEGSTNGRTKYLYDGADRVTDEITAVSGDEKWRTRTTYGGDRTTVDPPQGGTPTTTVVDARGHKTAEYRYLSESPTGASTVTRYHYSPEGQILDVTGPDNAKWVYTYFQNGRLKETRDPDTGTTTFGYDRNGNQTSRTTAAGTVTYVYDKINRKVEEWQGPANTGTRLASWVYDSYYKGQLAGTARYTAGGTYYITYPQRDNNYRLLKTSYIVPSDAGAELAATYDFSTSYNTDGTEQTVGLPAAGDLPGESLTIGYDGLRRPLTVTGLTSYVTGTDYTDTGQVLKRTLSTGGTGRTAWQTYDYERGTGRVIKNRLDRSGAPAVDLEEHYTYDPAGNVLSIADTPPGGATDTQCFTYDHLRQLTEAWSTGSTADDPCAGGPQAGTGGPQPYHQSWTFTDGGLRKSQTDYDPATGAVRSADRYVYPDNAAAQPHALRGVDRTVDGVTTRVATYTPNAAGNMANRNGATLTWTPENRLDTVSGTGGQNAGYVYDADGNRLVSRTATTVTLFLPGMELRLDTATRAVKGTRYYTVGGQLVASRTAAAVLFQITDPHGTSTCAVDAATGALTRRRLTPYGSDRGGSATAWPDQRGFLGGTMDAANGLVHLGAREYDPVLAQFISPDPVFDVDDPMSWNGYQYGKNNPLVYVDADGLRPLPEDDDGGYGNRWWALEHNAIVFAAVQLIRSQVQRRGGDPNRVTWSFHIPNGSYKAKNQKKVTTPGFVDIMYEDDSTIFIWEVKALGQGDDLAQDTIDHYAKKLHQNGEHRAIEQGWKLGQPVVAWAPGSPPGNYLVGYDGMTPGTILYSRFRAQDVKVPDPVRTPNPVPVPAATGVERVKVPTQPGQPTPAATPQPSANPWGPYGTPLPATDQPWWINEVTVCFAAFALPAVVVGLVAVGPEIAGAAGGAGVVTGGLRPAFG